jgi:hypothetical protein
VASPFAHLRGVLENYASALGLRGDVVIEPDRDAYTMHVVQVAPRARFEMDGSRVAADFDAVTNEGVAWLQERAADWPIALQRTEVEALMVAMDAVPALDGDLARVRQELARYLDTVRQIEAENPRIDLSKLRKAK